MSAAVPTTIHANTPVTVSVLTHNRKGEVLGVLARLRALPERPAIVIVDNGSADGTADAVQAAYPDVSVVRLHRNTGASGRNAGIVGARTPWVALSDDDTWWHPGALARAAALLEAHPRLAVVTARVLVGADAHEDPACRQMAASPLPRRPELPGVPVAGFMAGASVIRRDAVLAVGGFESRFFLGGEEELLAMDLLAAGFSLAYVPEVVAFHHPSPSRDATARQRMLVRNAIWSAWLRRRPVTALRRTWHVIRREPRIRSGIGGTLAALAGVWWVPFRRHVLPPDVERLLELLDQAGNGRVETTPTLTGITLAGDTPRGISTSEESHG
jgi:GT2 family glycosyltransferase